MNLLDKINFEASKNNAEIAAAEVEESQWTWVEGYKGTDKNMQGYGHFQWEIGKTEVCEGDIKLCENGFHFCLGLEEVMHFYPIEKENRYFRVKGLVKKEDLANYGAPFYYSNSKKCVSKELTIIEEIPIEEVIKTCYPNIPTKYYDFLLTNGRDATYRIMFIDRLKEHGYPEEMASFIIDHNQMGFALACGIDEFSLKERFLMIIEEIHRNQDRATHRPQYNEIIGYGSPFTVVP